MTTQAHRPRILAVEDDPNIRVLLRHTLGRAFEVELAGSIDAALEAAARTRFDLFLLDINLGERRTGVELLKLLRRMPAHEATPAVACTAYAMQSDRVRFLAEGFDEHVPKPFTREELRGQVEAVLRTGRRPAPAVEVPEGALMSLFAAPLPQSVAA